MLFYRYPKETKGYYFYLDEEHKVIMFRHVRFLENEYVYGERLGDEIELEEIQEKMNKKS